MARPRTPAGRARRTHELLAEEYPGTAKELCELEHEDAFQLLAATILSAQSTDKMVNSITPALFARFPDAESLAEADPAEVEALVQSSGFFRQKTKSLIGMARAVVDRFGGEVPHRIEDLVTLPGVGRKTANVVLNTAFGHPTIAVDTHIFRVANRSGIAPGRNVLEVERRLERVVPRQFKKDAHHWLILHGRYVCVARKPKCPQCAISDLCEYPDKTPA